MTILLPLVLMGLPVLVDVGLGPSGWAWLVLFDAMLWNPWHSLFVHHVRMTAGTCEIALHSATFSTGVAMGAGWSLRAGGCGRCVVWMANVSPPCEQRTQRRLTRRSGGRTESK
jgi:hypothetical protein